MASNNFFVFGVKEALTSAMIGCRFHEDGTVKEGIAFYINNTSTVHSTDLVNQAGPLPKDWKEVWQGALDKMNRGEDAPEVGKIPTGLLYTKAEDYPLGQHDNILADAWRLRTAVLEKARQIGLAGGDVTQDVGESQEPVVATAPAQEIWQKLGFPSKQAWKDAGRPKE